MKAKKLSILILIILLIITTCWLFIPNQFTESHEWIVYILAVPLGFFSIKTFSKLPSEKSLQVIIYITAGSLISLFLNRDFLSNLFVKNILFLLLGAVITFFVNKFINVKQKSK
jgi:formate hydrogenlyase subunit 3/multisubunit Na+/H+ antiporter MnhD subunit